MMHATTTDHTYSWRLCEPPAYRDGIPASRGLRDALDEEGPGAEYSTVEIVIDGKQQAEAAEILWYPAHGRGAMAWGADPVWSDAFSENDLVRRILTDDVID